MIQDEYSEPDIAELKLISPEEFKEVYAQKIGIAAVRSLFKSDGFPAVRIGTRFYTTHGAAKRYLQSLNDK